MLTIKVTKKGGFLYNCDNTVEALQNEVGGYVEAVPLQIHDIVICVLCDENGRLKNKFHTATIDNIPFYGDLIICGIDGDEFSDLGQDAIDLFTEVGFA